YFKKIKLSKKDLGFIEFKTRDTLPNRLFLSELRGKKFKLLDGVADWFKQTLALIDPNKTFVSMEASLNKENALQNYCCKSLKNAQTGIYQIDGELISFESAEIPTKLKDRIKETLKEGQGISVRSSDGKRFSFFLEKGKIKALQLVTVHKNISGRNI